MKKYYFILSLLFVNLYCLAQQSSFERISTKEGLPSSSVYDLALDLQGYLWVSSVGGLYRFDGYRFEKTSSLQNALSIDINKNGVLYNSATNYFYQINTKSLKSKYLIPFNYHDSIPNNDQYNNIYVDHEQNVWSCDFSNVKRYNPKTSTLEIFNLTSKVNSAFFATFIEDKNNQLFVPTSIGLFNYDSKNNTFHLQIKNKEFSCNAIYENSLYLGTNNGELIEYNILTGKYITYRLPINTNINFILSESDEKIWIGTNGHLFIYNTNTKSFTEELSLVDKSYNFKNAIIDNHNNLLWIATNSGLIKKILGKSKEINKINLPNHLVEFPVKVNYFLEYSPQKFYLALSHSGILAWNAIDNTFEKIPFKGSNDKINKLSIAKSGELYAAGGKGTYKLINRQLHNIIPSHTEIKSLLIDRSNRLWTLPDIGGIKVYNPKTLKSVQVFSNIPNQHFDQNIFFDIVENSDKKIWLAAWFPKGYGITLYNETKKTIEEIADYNDHKLFIADYFYNLSLTKKSTLAFLGYGGVNIVSKDGKIIKTVYEGTSINNIVIPNTHKVIIDSMDNIWLASTEGLYFINTNQNKMSWISELDGLANNDVSNALSLSSDNKLLMSSINTIEILDINEFIKYDTLPKVKLSNISILGYDKKINLDTALVFRRNENNLSFNFTTLSFLKPSLAHYQYKMLGSEKWIDNGFSNNVTFSNLNNGSHDFEVRVGDHLGNWSAKSCKISFYIQPAYYETITFRLLILLGMISLIGAFIYQRLASLNKTNSQKNEIAKLQEQKKSSDVELIATKNLLQSIQLDALRSQMNPHFIFNSLNSIENYILKNEKMIASQYLGKFSKLIRDILENSKSEKILLNKEIETLQLYVELENLRTSNSFDVIYDIPDSIMQDNITLPPMLMQPHVENAILHGLRYLEDKRGCLTITIVLTNDTYLEYSIQDNGIGIVKSKILLSNNHFQHKSYGLEITKSRIELYNQKYNTNITFQILDLYDDYHKPSGTKVIILIPLF